MKSVRRKYKASRRNSRQNLPYTKHKHGELNKKNSKFAQRSKDMVEYHKKQQTIEAKNSELQENSDRHFLALLEKEDSVLDSGTQLFEELVTKVPYEDALSNILNSEEHIEQTGNADDVKDDNFDQEATESTLLLHDRSEQSSDTYKWHLKHFERELNPKEVEDIISTKSEEIKVRWNGIGPFKVEIPLISCLQEETKQVFKQPVAITNATDLQSLNFKAPLHINALTNGALTLQQTELLHLINSYQDLYYPQRSVENAEKLRLVYCLHALNHMLKSRALILRNNEKLSAAAKNAKVSPNEMVIPDSYRDQGLMRLKVLIIVPFRDSAFKIVNLFIKFLYGEQSDQCKQNGSIKNYKRFVEDYTGDTLHFPKVNPKPLDYQQTFSGNTDDNFKIGLRLTKKSLALFSDLYASDILIASPLGLRMVIGSSGSKERDFDFLNSIEMLIMDQAELFLAQNWETLLLALDHIHLQPQKLSQTNCQRVRNWCLSGLSRFYRQTLLLSSHELPEFRAVINNKCHNYNGCAHIVNPVEIGDIRNVVLNVQQTFRLVNCNDFKSVFNNRFEYFIKDILPCFNGPTMAHCLIYVPSYFDFVRLRNHFKAESISFVQISEYTPKEKISRARDIFYHSGAQFMLYSERAHFYRRTRIKGIRHLIMYQPPNFPNLYSELINFMLESNQNTNDGLQNSMSVTVLYSKYDLLNLCNIVGSEAAKKLTNTKKSSYVFFSK